MNRQEYRLLYVPAGKDILLVMTDAGKQGWILCPWPVKKTVEDDIYLVRRPIDGTYDRLNESRIAANALLMRCAGFLQGFQDDPDQAPVVPDLIRDIYSHVEGDTP